MPTKDYVPRVRMQDLLPNKRAPEGKTFMLAVKVPAELNDKIDQIAGELGQQKTVVVNALLNDGIEGFLESRKKSKK